MSSLVSFWGSLDLCAPPNSLEIGRCARRSSAAWVKGVAAMFASQGLDVPRLFNAVGIDMGLLDKPDARFHADKVTELWELAVAWSGNAALGLDRELASRHVDFDVVGYAMLSSPDLHA